MIRAGATVGLPKNGADIVIRGRKNQCLPVAAVFARLFDSVREGGESSLTRLRPGPSMVTDTGMRSISQRLSAFTIFAERV